MILMKNRVVWGIAIAALAPAVTGTLLFSQSKPAADPLSDGAQNVRLVGYNDLQGRTALVVTTKSDPANGNWVYVGHHESFTRREAAAQPDHRKDGVQRHVDPRHRRPGQAEARLAHSRTRRTGIRAACRWSTTTSSTRRDATT